MTELPPGREVAELAELLREHSRSELGDSEWRLKRASFMAKVDTALGEPQRPSLRPLWAALTFVVVAAAAVVLLVRVISSPSLSYEVAGAPREGDYVRAASDRPVTLTFSDKTTVHGAPDSRFRIDGATEQGARVVVERGRADVRVMHRPSTMWNFVAGPFDVRVTGTRFSLDWDPSRETLDLELIEGSVEVRGASGSGPWAVRAGQRFRADLRGTSMVVSSVATDGGTPAAKTGAPPLEPAAETPNDATPSSSAPSAAAGKGSSPAGESWDKRITRGEFKQIVSEAESRGIAGCLARCSPNDLRALSDAARYTSRWELAEQSLLSLRKRFGSGAGGDASFLLGRLEERRGGSAAALRWYDTYLKEVPSGAFSAEALAGKMRATRAASGAKAAAPLARDYLERFPKGVHVGIAREILASQ